MSKLYTEICSGSDWTFYVGNTLFFVVLTSMLEICETRTQDLGGYEGRKKSRTTPTQDLCGSPKMCYIHDFYSYFTVLMKNTGYIGDCATIYS